MISSFNSPVLGTDLFTLLGCPLCPNQVRVMVAVVVAERATVGNVTGAEGEDDDGGEGEEGRAEGTVPARARPPRVGWA